MMLGRSASSSAGAWAASTILTHARGRGTGQESGCGEMPSRSSRHSELKRQSDAPGHQTEETGPGLFFVGVRQRHRAAAGPKRGPSGLQPAQLEARNQGSQASSSVTVRLELETTHATATWCTTASAWCDRERQ
jgi:hypothetical protein